jgi:hypothetical protein
MKESGLNRRASEIRDRLGSHPTSRAKARTHESGSGLKKAADLRRRLGGDARPDAYQAKAEIGIDADDRREIEREIDEVSKRNRMAFGSEAFVVNPRRKGFVFPLIVNLAALAITVASVFLLARAFGQKQLEGGSSESSVSSAEGILLQELKRDSESRIQEKDKSIADIRARISSLDRERSELAGSIDARVKAKEAELKSSLKAELEAERKRLGTTGLSEESLAAKLKAFEAKKSLESDKSLAEERARAASEKKASEESYGKLKDDYQKSLASLGEERQGIQAAAKKREDELRSSMDAKNKELESRGAAAQASLDKARSELARLSDQKAKAQGIEDRILGLYDRLRAALRDGRYADAVSGSAALAGYLEDTSLDGEASIKERRSADLFVAQTIGTYARSELERSKADTESLLRQAELLAAARDASTAADKALRAGDPKLAAAKYGEALAKVPEILAAHQYFMGLEKASEASRRARLDESLAAADKAYRAKDAATASARYAEALSYLPIDAASREAIASHLAEQGTVKAASAAGDADKSAEAEKAAADTKAARGPLAAAAKEASAKNWARAIGAYISMLSAYPRAAQAPEALAGIEGARAGMEREAAESASAQKAVFDAKAAALVLELAEARKALSDAKGELASARATAAPAPAPAARASESPAAPPSIDEAELKARIADLERRLAAEASETSRAAAQAKAVAEAAANAAKDGQIEALKAELIKLNGEIDRLNEAAASNAGYRADAARYRALAESYSSFLASEASSPKGALVSSIASQAAFYSFLGGEGVEEAFPGLREKVSRYQSESREESQNSFPSDAAEIVRQAAGYRDKAAREAYFASRREVYTASGNALMAHFIDALEKSAY